MDLSIPFTTIPRDDPVFPTEVFEAIIRKLADDLDALRSCALVSWTFYHLACLFSHVQVGPRSDQEQSLAKLCELLEGSPSFAVRVQSLRVCDNWKENHTRWKTEADFGRCLSLLGSLTSLCIEANGPYRLPWSEISAANRAAIQAILPTLTCLELYRVCELPLKLLSHSSALRSLILSDVVFNGDSDSAVTTATGSRGQLHHIRLQVPIFFIDKFHDWITSLESPLDISCLRSLECTVEKRADEFPIQRLLDASSPSLQHLCLYAYTYFSFYDDSKLDLSRLAHLQSLSLNIWVETFSSANYPYLLSLRPLVLPPLQQKLSLVFHFRLADYLRPDLFQAVATADSVLAALQAVASVTLIFWHGDRKERLIDVSERFIQHMPLLANRFSGTGALRVLKSARVDP
ncbi:hypothetical protein C8R45DRAFT_1212864 [Mycena sanguinolenta]|nr:hypothetical protein C8R45DRAFT_1212864 [Mycena sanguinolenta]